MALVGIIILAIDQLTKFLVASRMELGESFPVLGEYFKITSHRNSGAAWGMFEGRMAFFYIIALVVLVFLFYIYKTEAKNNLLRQVGITLLMAGALGDFIDRLLVLEVVDFLAVLLITYDVPICSVGDRALTAGVILLLIEVFI